MELMMLKGSIKTLKRCHPHLQLEVSDLCLRYGYNHEDLVSYLKNIGYSIFLYLNDQKKLKSAQVNDIKNHGSENCFFIHSSKIKDFDSFLI